MGCLAGVVSTVGAMTPSTAPGALADSAAAGALADLFFHAPTLSEEDKIRANDLRRKYRDWRSAGGTVPGQGSWVAVE